MVLLRFNAGGKIITAFGEREEVWGVGAGALNTAPGAGALEITVLRVSEIASAILIMSPPLIPYVHWLRERGRGGLERGKVPPTATTPPTFPPTLLTSSDSSKRKKKKSRYQRKQPSSVSCLTLLYPTRVSQNNAPPPAP